jgi:hypothetical protein
MRIRNVSDQQQAKWRGGIEVIAFGFIKRERKAQSSYLPDEL